MTFNLGYQSGLLLFFFLQGLIFSGLLLKKGLETDSRSACWLSLFIFLCCLYICPWMFGHANWYAMDGYREVLFFIPFQHYFLMAPVILFYVKSMTNPGFRLQQHDWLHFLPAILFLLYSLVVFVTDVFILDEFWFYADGRDKDLDPVYQVAGTAWMIGYTFLSMQVYKQYRKKIVDVVSFADAITFRWLKQFLIALLIILTARVVFFLLFPNWGDFGYKFWYYVIFSCLFYYVALKGFINVLEVTIPYRWPDNISEPVPAVDDTSTSNPIEQKEGATKPSVSDHQKELIKNAVGENNFYRRPTLTLAEFAGETGMSTKDLSESINQGFGMNFNDFINSYRVDEVKRRLSNGDHHQLTLLSIAMDAGFNSKSTFNRAFKKQTGLSPAAYISKNVKG